VSSSTPMVTVIMRSKNSEGVIGQALNGLFSQDFRDFELIVVDSGSTDHTLDIVQRYSCRLIQIEAKSYYPGIVLNMAIANAKAELIVFQNSDTVPLTPLTLSHLVEAFEDSKVQAAFARQVPRPEAKTWVRFDYDRSFPPSAPTPPWITLSLPMAAMRKSAWESHPFYTDAWASEDTEWGLWAMKMGYKVQYVPKALVMHSHNYSLRQLHGRRFVEGEADAFIYGQSTTFFRVFGKILKDSIWDAADHLRSADLGSLPMILPRRFVFHYAHYKGHKWGEKRIATGNEDGAVGQAFVLSRRDD